MDYEEALDNYEYFENNELILESVTQYSNHRRDLMGSGIGTNTMTMTLPDYGSIGGGNIDDKSFNIDYLNSTVITS